MTLAQRTSARVAALLLRAGLVQVLGLALGLAMVGGCGKPKAHTDSKSASTEPRGAIDPESGFVYSPARWRLATFAELERSTVWLSHIAIRHDQADPSLLRTLTWRPDPPNPQRPMAEARALAERIAAEAAATPSAFAALARKYSEDVVTRELGGSLGGVRASQLAVTGLLDAAAALKPGQVSKAFRTAYGFHVLKREAPPSDEQLAGERIVIAYDGAVGAVRPVTRSRAQAAQRALEARERARANPAAFHELVVEYSDHGDRAQAGDIGVYSRRDPEYLPLEIEALARLREGEISELVDSRFGFTILKRTPVEARAAYAMTAIELRFDPARHDGPASQAAAFELARELGRELASDPSRFAELQRQHCCARVQRWTRGRGPLGLSERLDQLSPGQIAKVPWLWDDFYLIPQRVAPELLPPEPPRTTEVPSPARPNFDALLELNNAKQIGGAARALAEAVRKQPKLSKETIDAAATPLLALAHQLEQGEPDPRGVRRDVHETLALLKAKLGPKHFSHFTAFATKWAIDQMMPPISEPAP